MRKLALIPFLMLVLAACNGATLPATNVTSSSATLNGQGSCGTNADGSPGSANCSYYFQYGVGQYDNANNFSINYSHTTPVRGPFGSTCGNGCTVQLNPENVTGLSPGTTYRYQLCGKGDDITTYTCVGPNASTNYQSFTTAGPPPPESFGRSAVTVTPGSTLSLHWNRNENEYFILASSGANAFPNFQTAATFPAPGGTWQGAPYNWWVTGARAVSLAIPATAAPGSTYVLQLYTCNAAVNLCSNSLGSTTPDSTVTITVAGSNWTAEPYSQQFPTVTAAKQSGGAPLDVAFGGSSSNNTTIYDDSEFSNALGQTAAGQSTVTLTAEPDDVSRKPFGVCAPFATPCVSNSISELGERVVSTPPESGFPNGLVWFTQGGSYGLTPPVPNHSEVVAYDPANGGFCTYQVPGDGNSVIGLAVTGTGASTTVWFVEGAGHAIDSFSPSQVGMNCLAGGQFYPLSTSTPSFRQIPWPGSAFPSMITPDPNGVDLWVTDLLSNTVADVNSTTGTLTSHPIAGPSPWQVAVDGTYVYAIDYGAQQLVRINKATLQTDTVQLPVTTDQEEGYGLALSGSRLYFTLSNDANLAPPIGFSSATTFGYVDLASWAPGSQPTNAVVFTGLSAKTNPSSGGDFRGIAVASDGEIALADSSQVATDPNQVIRLSK